MSIIAIGLLTLAICHLALFLEQYKRYEFSKVEYHKAMSVANGIQLILILSIIPFVTKFPFYEISYSMNVLFATMYLRSLLVITPYWKRYFGYYMGLLLISVIVVIVTANVKTVYLSEAILWLYISHIVIIIKNTNITTQRLYPIVPFTLVLINYLMIFDSLIEYSIIMNYIGYTIALLIWVFGMLLENIIYSKTSHLEMLSALEDNNDILLEQAQQELGKIVQALRD